MQTGNLLSSSHETSLHAKRAVLIMLLQDNKQIHEASARTNWAWFTIDSSFLAEQLVNWIKAKMCGSRALECSLRPFSGHSGSWIKELTCQCTLQWPFLLTQVGKARGWGSAVRKERKKLVSILCHPYPRQCIRPFISFILWNHLQPLLLQLFLHKEKVKIRVFLS